MTGTQLDKLNDELEHIISKMKMVSKERQLLYETVQAFLVVFDLDWTKTEVDKEWAMKANELLNAVKKILKTDAN